MDIGVYKGRLVDQRLDLRGYVVLPELVNLHHHFFQALLKNIPSLQDISLFRWLRDIQMLMGEIRDEELFVATKSMSLSYSFPVAQQLSITTIFAPSPDLHIILRSRLSMKWAFAIIMPAEVTLGFDHIVEKEGDALTDTERLIKTYHDPKPAGMVRIENAPGAPFSMSARFF